MVMRSIVGLGAALALAGHSFQSFATPDAPRDAKRERPTFRASAPNDFGPVIDTTPESKRARRRRLARAKS